MIKIVGFIPIFQSTLPREERRPCSRHSLRILLFQSTLPREERRYPHGLQSLLFHNFNPRSHERSDIPAGSFHCCLHYISIHAPTRGATSISVTQTAKELFQSTLPREERRQSTGQMHSTRYFNPRSHERSDSNIAQKICLFLYNTDNKYIIR